jgi:hypothetical protein
MNILVLGCLAECALNCFRKLKDCYNNRFNQPAPPAADVEIPVAAPVHPVHLKEPVLLPLAGLSDADHHDNLV